MSKTPTINVTLPLTNPHKNAEKDNKKKNGFSRCGSESLLLQPKTSTSSSQLQNVGSTMGKKLKLRDYLFLMQTNSKRMEAARGESPERVQKMKTSASTHCLKNSISTRSIKYEIDNSHVLSVVQADLQNDLMAIREKADKISEGLKHSLKEDSLGDDEMVEIYALRRKVKEKLKEMEEMEHFVETLKKKERMQEAGLSMSIIYQKEELKKLESSRQEAQQEAMNR